MADETPVLGAPRSLQDAKIDPDFWIMNDTTQARLATINERASRQVQNTLRAAFAMLSGERPPAAAELLRAFVLGDGGFADSERARLSELADSVARREQLIEPHDRLFHHPWRPKASAVEKLCPDLVPYLLPFVGDERLGTVTLLDASSNEIQDLSFPPVVGLIHFPRRPGLRAFVGQDVAAYVHPFQYQLLTSDRSAAWISGSPRFLSSASLPDLPVRRINGRVVLVQDRFSFGNLSHFLFDGVTRLIHYLASSERTGDELFVMGGVPGRYHGLVLAALCRRFKVDPTAIWWPTDSELLQGRDCVWFSDQVEASIHPAQMHHPRSVAALAELCADIPAAPGLNRRVYISRADARTRRVQNESDLVRALEAHNFVSVELSGLSAEEQIGVFRGADVVVAPHGQGLTHVIMSGRLGHVVELVSSSAGTDCYACISRTLGVRHDAVVGTTVPGTPGDFHIEPSLVVRSVIQAEDKAPSPFKTENLVPASSSFVGFQAEIEASLAPEHQMIWGQHAMRLRVRNPAPRGSLRRIGGWPRVQVTARRRYTLSAWVMIPSGGGVRGLRLAIGDWLPAAEIIAAPGCEGQWQRIHVTADAPCTDCTSIDLHADCAEDTTILTTCWHLTVGDAPTAYVATG